MLEELKKTNRINQMCNQIYDNGRLKFEFTWGFEFQNKSLYIDRNSKLQQK